MQENRRPNWYQIALIITSLLIIAIGIIDLNEVLLIPYWAYAILGVAAVIFIFGSAGEL
jgi:hypothetical protein